MIGKLFVLLAGVLWLTGCGASDPLADHDWPAASPALWEVTAPDGKKGWLFGTVHALPDGVEWRSDAVDTAFVRSGLLVVEIADLNQGDQAAAAFADVSHTPDLPPLSKRVGPGQRPALAALMQRAGASDGDFTDTETWAAALMLAGMVRSGNPANGVDRSLLAEGRPALGLESYGAQYALFDSLPAAGQRALLLSVAHESVAADPAASISAWLTGDLDTLERISDTGMLAEPELRQTLADDRNRAWAERIAELIGQGRDPFVAVGAAHMLGDAGLPALLAARGFAVERLQ